MRTIDQLINRRKGIIASSNITQEERALIHKELQAMINAEPVWDLKSRDKELYNARIEYGHRIHQLRRALDNH